MESLGLKQRTSPASIVVAIRDQVSADLAGEAAILNLKSGVYYGLDAVGARIWQLIQEPRTVASIRTVLLSEYEVDPDRCERDLLLLLHALADAGLLEIRDDTAPQILASSVK